MLTEKDFLEATKDYEDVLVKENIKKGIVYNADFTCKNIQQGMPDKIDSVVFNVEKPYLSLYPCIAVSFLSNLREIGGVFISKEEHIGEPTIKDNIDENLGLNFIIDFSKFKEFLKAIKLGEVRKELYVGERDKLKNQIANIEAIIKENNLE